MWRKLFNSIVLLVYCLTTVGIPSSFGLPNAGCQCAADKQNSGSCCCQAKAAPARTGSCCHKPAKQPSACCSSKTESTSGTARPTSNCCHSSQTGQSSGLSSLSALCSCGDKGTTGLFILTDPRHVSPQLNPSDNGRWERSKLQGIEFRPGSAPEPETPPPRLQPVHTLG
jgi:hypothetical protein